MSSDVPIATNRRGLLVFAPAVVALLPTGVMEWTIQLVMYQLEIARFLFTATEFH